MVRQTSPSKKPLMDYDPVISSQFYCIIIKHTLLDIVEVSVAKNYMRYTMTNLKINIHILSLRFRWENLYEVYGFYNFTASD